MIQVANGKHEYRSGRDMHIAETIYVYNQEQFRRQSVFHLVDKAYLENERRRAKEPFIARPPTWADVVHGEDATIGFIERDE